MRIKLFEFFGLLSEAKCPVCGSDGAYVGLNKIECPNKKCKHFERSLIPKGSEKFGLFGITWGDGDFDPDEFKKAVEQKGFVEKGDDYFPVFYDPKHWKQHNKAGSFDAKKTIYAGHYDDIYWEALSPEAVEVAKILNDPDKNPEIKNPQNRNDTENAPDMGHLEDIYENWDKLFRSKYGDSPFWEGIQEVAEFLGIDPTEPL